MTVSGRLVIIAGATSASGHAAARVLRDAGARVVAVGRDAGRLRDLLDSLETVPASSRRGAAASPLAAAPASDEVQHAVDGSVRRVDALCERSDRGLVAQIADFGTHASGRGGQG